MANATSFTDNATDPSQPYRYHVVAFNAAGETVSNVVTVLPAPPAAPTTLVATAVSASQVNLTWTDNATSETGFRIERALVTGGTTGAFAAIGTVAANVTTYSDITTTFLTTYAYRVFAFNVNGDSLPSNVATVTTPVAPPVAPTGLSAILQTGPQIALAWTDNANNETNFVVERAVNTGAFTSLATLPANTVSYTDTTTTAGNTYTYRVKATNAGGSSGYSNTASVTIMAVPAAPTSLTATLLSAPTRVRLTWFDNATTETGFVVERAVNGGAYTVLITVPANTGTGTVTYGDTTVVHANTYAYRVRAINIGGPSAYSNVANITIGNVPAAPTNLLDTLLAGPLRVRLTWTDNATNETNFVLERAVNGGAFSVLATAPAKTGTGAVNYTDTTVSVGNTYDYRVRAMNAVGFSAYSNIFTVSVTAPAAPSSGSAAIVLNGASVQVSLTWTDNATNEASFQIQRATNGGAFTALATAPANPGTGPVNYTDTTVLAGNTYSYKVLAVNVVGSSVYSNIFTVSVIVPAAPSSPSATVVLIGANDQVTLTWTDNANNETSFQIQRATNATFTAGLVNYTAGANVTTFQQNVARAKTFYYRIRSVNLVGASAWVNFVPFKIVTP